MNRHLLDQYDLLIGHLLLLQNPLQLSQADQRIGGLQRINDEQNVMVYDRFLRSFGELGARPGGKAFDAGLGETAKAVVKEAEEMSLLFRGKHWFALRQ